MNHHFMVFGRRFNVLFNSTVSLSTTRRKVFLTDCSSASVEKYRSHCAQWGTPSSSLGGGLTCGVVVFPTMAASMFPRWSFEKCCVRSQSNTFNLQRYSLT